jgi:FdhD protein
LEPIVVFPMLKPPVAPAKIWRFAENKSVESEDLLVTEEPLAIRLGFSSAGERIQKDLAVTMRTPGNDFELALGFLFSEGIIKSYENIRSIKHCTNPETEFTQGDILKIELAESIELPLSTFQRHSYITSACGVCGKNKIDAIYVAPNLEEEPLALSISADVLLQLAHSIESRQRIFSRTGGIHAAGLFSIIGEVISFMEDIGRHNAVDKLIGSALINQQLPLLDKVLFLSSRSSFESVSYTHLTLPTT